MNGDGMQDLVVPGKTQWVWLRSTGTTFQLEQFPTPLPLRDDSSPGGDNVWWNTPVLADVDGDSFPDVVQFQEDQHFQNDGFPVLRFTGPAQPEVAAITDSLGARTAVTHAPLKDSAVYTTGSFSGYPQHSVAHTPRRVVSKVDTWNEPFEPAAANPALPALETKYQYTDARIDLPRHQWLGFQRRDSQETVDPMTSAAALLSSTTVFYDLDTYDATVNMYPFALQPLETDYLVPIGGGSTQSRVERTTNTPASRVEGSRGISTWIQHSDNAQIEGSTFVDDLVIASHSATFDPPDKYGNTTHRTDSWSPSNETRDLTLKYAWSTGDTSESGWQVDQVSHRTEKSTVTDSSGAAVSKTRQEDYGYYDNGLLKTDSRVGGGVGESRDTAFTRDVYGNVTDVAIGNSAGTNRSTHITYDAPGFAPISVRNGKDQTTTVVIDARFGALTHVVDPNNLVTDIWFDDFGRPRKVVKPDNTTEGISYQFGPASTVPFQVQTSAQGGEDTTINYDVLGREFFGTRTGLGGLIAESQRFDDRGFRVFVDWPHRATLVQPKAITSTLDNLGRLTQLFRPEGVVNACYKGLTSCETNSNGYTKCKIRDALRRLVAAVDPQPGAPEDCPTALARAASRPATVYTYGPFGDLHTVTDVKGNVTTIETDSYGRRTAVTDPDSGRKEFGFDGLDELWGIFDANQNSIILTRDALGRVIQRDEGITNKPNVALRSTKWSFDGDDVTTPGELVGTLTQVKTPDGHSETYHYDVGTGRLLGVDEEVAGLGGGTFSATFGYNSDGLVADIGYPTAPGLAPVAVHHAYDGHGHLTGLKDLSKAIVPLGTFWSVNPASATDDYDQLQAETFGNGVSTTRSYTVNGSVEDIESTINGAAIQHLHYSVDPEGNVLNRQDVLRGQWESFAYDHLARIHCSLVGSNTEPAALSPDCVGSLTDIREYDELGRIRSTTGAGSYDYTLVSAPGQPLHAAQTVGATEYLYDSNGNRRSDFIPGGTAHGYTWNAFNNPIDTWREGATPNDKLDVEHFEYDSNQTRIRKETPTLITAYLDGLYEQRTSKTGAATEHVFYVSNGSRVVAQVTQTSGQTTNTVEYIQDDHLGSSQLLTASSGIVLEERSYDAFGQGRNPENWLQPSGASTATNVTSGFTGHENDAELGLVNMRGREYDPRIGQFLQADPIVQDPTNSQSLNRYSYVLNNPMKLVDPSGFDGDGADSGSSDSFDDSAAAPPPSKGDFVAHPDPAVLGRAFGGQVTVTHSATQEGQPTGNSQNPGAASASSFDAKAPGADSPGQRAPGGSFAPDFGRIPNSMRRPGRVAQVGPVEADEDDDDIDPEVQWGQRLEPLPESETNLPIVPALPFVDELNRQSAESRAEEILKSLDTPDGCRVPTVEEQFELDKATLKAHADSATARYNREGVTPNQARALVRNPFLIFKFRGERIDAFWRQLVEQDLDLLLRWELTPRGQTGPDILHLTLPGVWGDATTPDAFEKHVNEYFYSHGESGFLIYVAPLRF